jgi:hypothetical protein
VTSLPSMTMLPASTGHTPATALSMVDFPAPLPPMTVMKSPSAQVQIQVVERPLFVDGAGVEGLGDVVDVKH